MEAAETHTLQHQVSQLLRATSASCREAFGQQTRSYDYY